MSHAFLTLYTNPHAPSVACPAVVTMLIGAIRCAVPDSPGSIQDMTFRNGGIGCSLGFLWTLTEHSIPTQPADQVRGGGGDGGPWWWAVAVGFGGGGGGGL